MGFVLFVLQVLMWIIIADAVLSWVVSPDRFPRSLTAKITAPLYRPLHRLLDPARTGGIDLAPLVVLLLIQGAISFLHSSFVPSF